MNRRLGTILRCLGIALVTFGAGLAQPAPPQTLGYQGFLTSAAGVPVTSPPAVSMTFSLFAAPAGGSPLWRESQAVTVSNGAFSVVLGTGTLLAGAPLGSLAFDVPYFLEVTAGGDTLLPRRELTASPYAFRALSLEPSATVAASQVTGALTGATISGAQVTGQVPGGVPPGYMILGTTSIAPPGFDLVGPLAGGYNVFVRQGLGGQSILPSVPSVTVNEGGTAAFTASLSLAPAADTTVFVSSGNTAAVTASPATLTFTPANYATPQAITVTGVQDPDLADDAATITLAAAGIPNATVAVTAIDDDAQTIVRSASSITVAEGGATTFTVNLSHAPAGNVTVTVASANTAAVTVSPSTLTFTPANYAVPQTVTANGTQDANAGSESTTINLSSATAATVSVGVTTIDDEVQAIFVSHSFMAVSEGGTTAFTATLAYQPVANVVVSVSSDTPASVAVSPSTLTFTPGNYAVPQTVTVSAPEDDNALNEAAVVSLGAPGVATSSVNVQTNDNDSVNFLAVSVPTLDVNEGGTATFTVHLSFTPPGAGVTVSISSDKLSVATVSPASLVFTPANFSVPQTVTVTGVPDPNLVNDPVTITVSGAFAAARTVAVTVVDTGP